MNTTIKSNPLNKLRAAKYLSAAAQSSATSRSLSTALPTLHRASFSHISPFQLSKSGPLGAIEAAKYIFAAHSMIGSRSLSTAPPTRRGPSSAHISHQLSALLPSAAAVRHYNSSATQGSKYDIKPPTNWGIWIVIERTVFVIERFDKYAKMSPGIHFLIPGVDRIAYLGLELRRVQVAFLSNNSHVIYSGAPTKPTMDS